MASVSSLASLPVCRSMRATVTDTSHSVPTSHFKLSFEHAMAGRAVLSYDDITQPSAIPPTVAVNPPNHLEGPPAKKPRWMKAPKTNGPQQPKRARTHHQAAHWDSSVESNAMVSYDAIDPTPSSSFASTSGRAIRSTDGPSSKAASSNGRAKNSTQKSDHSVSLGDSDAWDDSSLIDAWEAANEEYEVRAKLPLPMVIADGFVLAYSWAWKELEG